MQINAITDFNFLKYNIYSSLYETSHDKVFSHREMFIGELHLTIKKQIIKT